MNRFLMIGVFVLAGLALFTAGLFMIGNRHEAFARHVELYTEFADVSGIVPGAKDRKSTRLNSSHERRSRMPSSA